MVGDSSDSDFDDDFESSDFGEFDDEFDGYEDDVTSDIKENKFFTHTEFSNTIDIYNNIFKIYQYIQVKLLMNHSSYVKCKVFEKKYMDEQISEDNDHHIPTGNNYMVFNYLEKTFENF